MLLVNARCGPSKIHGLGLIAREFIPAGTPTWVYQPGFDVEITEEQFLKLSIPSRKQVRYYAAFLLDRRVFILSSDDDRFTNHSPHPNTRIVGGGGGRGTSRLSRHHPRRRDHHQLPRTGVDGVPKRASRRHRPRATAC